MRFLLSLMLAAVLPLSSTTSSNTSSTTTAATWTAKCAGLVCSFNSAKSTGTITARRWTFGDGTPVVTVGAGDTLVHHAYAAAGVYSVRGEVYDPTANTGKGRWYYTSKNVTVTAAIAGRVDTVRIQLPPPPAVHDTVRVQLPAPPAVHDTVRVQLPPLPAVHDTVRILNVRVDTVRVCPDTTRPPEKPPVTTPPVTPPTTPPTTPPVTPPTTPPATPPAGGETFATLPQLTVDVSLPVQTGTVRRVTTSAELSAALAASNYGDVVELQNGATFTGHFTLPGTGTGSGWIILRPSDTTRLPAPGARMTPAIAAAAQLPRIVSPDNLGAINTTASTHHWRVIGVEVTNVVYNTGLVRLGDASGTQTTLASVPHHLILDRVYVHGAAGLGMRRCVSLNSAYSAVVDSYLSACVDKGSDAQAVWGSNGPGPFLVENNYLEGSGESIMFGGADPLIPNLIPSDITIRRNHIYKPLAWKGVWTVKNLFESKNSQRMLVEGNILDGNWTDAQTGGAVNIKAVNQTGSCTWCTTRDLTFRYNIIRNVGSGFVLVGSDPGIAVHTARVTITDNLLYGMNTAAYPGDGRGMLVNNDPTDFTVAHNTIPDATAAAVYYGGGVPVRFTVRDNVIAGGAYGVKGQGPPAGTATLTATNTTFVGNMLSLTSTAGYPAGNCYVTALTLTSSYQLTPGSPCAKKATDGRDPGADIAAVLAATAGVIVP